MKGDRKREKDNILHIGIANERNQVWHTKKNEALMVNLMTWKIFRANYPW